MLGTLFGFLGRIGPWELALILLIVLIIVGPGKLPQIGQSLGKAMQSFRKAQEGDIQEGDSNNLEDKNK